MEIHDVSKLDLNEILEGVKIIRKRKLFYFMLIPSEIVEKLRLGDSIAAELENSAPDMKTYLIIIPKRSESKYEIRYLEHNKKYTDTDWGLDYDYVLDDKSTRIKRIFVESENEIANVLFKWIKDLTVLTTINDFDSSLIHSPIDCYLERTDERPHLWK